ncbi:MAG TPA: thioredoxin-disulfide reductase [Ktedonobacterales bacterium]|nr:thioredoxin-disulfide reductase [Ktedonobacterales bacterium]
MTSANGANGTDGAQSDTYDVIIIGSGPAGYTAALYAARANLKTLVLQGDEIGGQLMITSDVENYPGFVEGILGPEMMEKFEAQAKRFGAEMVARQVQRVDFSQQPFTVYTDDTEYRGDSVIVATGASAKWLGLPNEQRLRGRGVSGCATCDGFFFRGKDVAVIGGGDTAMEEALFLTRYANKVYLVHRRDSFRASKIMQDRARKNEKIAIITSVMVEDVLGDGAVEGVVLKNIHTGKTQTLPVQGFFVAIGHQPNTDIFQGILEMDGVGYLKTHRHTMTSVEGVFAAGDVVDHRYRQAVTAAGDGCRAAIDAERWLEARGEINPETTIDAGEWGVARKMLEETGQSA